MTCQKTHHLALSHQELTAVMEALLYADCDPYSVAARQQPEGEDLAHIGAVRVRLRAMLRDCAYSQGRRQR